MDIFSPTPNNYPRFYLLCFSALGLLTGVICSTSLAQKDDSLEGLYLAAEKNVLAGHCEEALTVYKKLINIYKIGSIDVYGSGLGSIYFDYGTCLLQLFRWEEARIAFKTCAEDLPNPPAADRSKLYQHNYRWSLAIFQWGHCEQMLKNPEKALDLYQRYIDSKPDTKELETVRNIFILRKGGALISSGKIEEGEAEITKLFINGEAWKVEPQLLMQGLLELGQGWVEQAKNND